MASAHDRNGPDEQSFPEEARSPRSTKGTQQTATSRGLCDFPEIREDLHVVLLMGQSNMVGTGEVLAEDTRPLEGVFVLEGECAVHDPTPRQAIAWRPGSHPVHVSSGGGFGLGLEFARVYRVAFPGVSVGLIPCAWKGASVAQLGPGSPLYQNAIIRARRASRDGVIKAVLWHQGEAECRSAEAAFRYEASLRGLVDALRRDLGEQRLPFVVGDLAPGFGTKRAVEAGQWIETVCATLRRFPQRVEAAAYVASAGLEVRDDAVHFTRTGLMTFGWRYADSLVGLLERESTGSSRRGGVEGAAE